MKRLVSLLVLTAGILTISSLNASAQAQQPEPKKQYLTLYIDWTQTAPASFREDVLQNITGTPLFIEVKDNHTVYSSADGTITVTDRKFQTNTKSAGIMLYPFGAGNGISLAVKGSYGIMPDIQFTINSPVSQKNYVFTNGKAYDFGIGLISLERSPGWWGFGSNAFVLIGTGRIYESQGQGQRYFLEGGGGLNFGMLGAGLVIKFSRDQIPSLDYQKVNSASIGIRTTLSF